MNTLLVWILVTTGGLGGNNVVYSPPMADVESCKVLAANIRDMGPTNVRCIQIRLTK